MLQNASLLTILFLQILACSICTAYPYIVVPADFEDDSSSAIAKRSFDRVDQGSFGFQKRAFDRLSGSEFGLDKRSIVKRAFDRLEMADFGLRRKRAFDRLARSEFGLRRKRSFDRLAGSEFGLMKRSVPVQEDDRESLVRELASSIAALRQARAAEAAPVLVEDLQE